MSAIAHKSEVIDTYGLTDSAKLAFGLFRAKERLAPSGTGPGLVRFSGWNFERKEPIDGSAKSPGDPGGHGGGHARHLVRGGRLRDPESIPSAGALERARTLVMIREGFNDEIEKLDRANSDLSVYDATYDSMPKPSEEFLRSLLGENSGGWLEQQGQSDSTT
jgi:hypothetical protein